MKIAFWDNCLSERGTSIALYDYAYYNQKLLNNESIIMYDSNSENNIPEVIDKFKNSFSKVYATDGFENALPILKEENCDILYIIKYGVWDEKVSYFCKTVVHCVFDCFEPHGNVYCSVAPNLPGHYSGIPVLPHMINLPDINTDLREELNIPKNATVFGRHGGPGEFDDTVVQQILYLFLKNNPNIYAVFLNTDKFCDDLPNLIHLPRIIDLKRKTEFINTCDAMIWARCRGESFGLSIGEFSTRNKPVFCKHGTDENRHLEILKDKCIMYNHQNLYQLLKTFDREQAKTKDWNAYRDYTPEKVMELFKKIVIES